jgi:hypothetical protein
LLALAGAHHFVHVSRVRVNGLPFRVKDLSGDVKEFKFALKEFLLAGSYYSIQEFFDDVSIKND